MKPGTESTLEARSRPRSAARRRGMALVWVAILLFLTVALVGIAIDTAYVLFVAHQLQNCADAASLAGAAKVRQSVDDARVAARDIAADNAAAGEPVSLDLNLDNAAGGDIVVGRFNRTDRTFTPQLSATNAVRVTARRSSASPDGPVALLFGPVFGVATANVSREAVAMVGGGTGAGVIALDNDAPCGLEVQGTVTLRVDGGDIQVNSSHPSRALCVNGTPVIDGPVINVNGNPRMVGTPTFDGEMNTGAPQVPDPLAFLPEPTWDPAANLGTVKVSSGGPVRLSPGYYAGGIEASGGSLVLDPGIYILDGAGLNISGNTDFTALGVMFYVVGTGVVDLTGTGDIRVTPPDPSLYSFPGADTYEGVSIFQARDNTNDARIIGTSLLDLEGALYFPKNHLTVGGTGDGFGNQLVANTIEVHGTGDITIRYDGRFPAPGNRVFLVR